jgi:hypothetical protein
VSEDTPDPGSVPINPSLQKVFSRVRPKEYQLEAIAQMSTMGTPTGTMAAVTGLDEAYVNRLMSGKSNNQTFNKFREDYQRKNLRKTVGFQFELSDMLPEVLNAYRDGLQAHDPRLRFEVAKEIVNRVVPDLNGKNGKGHSTDVFQFIVNQPQVQTQIGETMASVARSLDILRGEVQRQDPDAHVLLGAEALPIPESQLEVTGGEASLEPTEKPGTDLLTELIERDDDTLGGGKNG